MKTLTYIEPSKRGPNGGGLYLNYRQRDEELLAAGIDSIHSAIFEDICKAYNQKHHSTAFDRYNAEHQSKEVPA